MAFRQIINKILIRMRESTIGNDWSGAINDSSSVDDYQQLIGELVNEAKQVVEDAWNWGCLRTLKTVTTVDSTPAYTISDLNERSRVLQVLDNTNDCMLRQISDADFYHYTYIGDTQTGAPLYYRLKDNEISFWPTPDAVYDIKVHAVQPQDDLTYATDTLTVQEHLVVLGAYALALNERGEDAGTVSDTAASRFSNALSDAISQDECRTVNETTWNAV